MKPGRIVLIALGFIVLCLAFYCLFPKYEVEVLPLQYRLSSDIVPVVKWNRITGQAILEYVGQAYTPAPPSAPGREIPGPTGPESEIPGPPGPVGPGDWVPEGFVPAPPPTLPVK